MGILADRDFIGERWLRWLKAENIGFYIRIEKDVKAPISQGGNAVQAKQLFQFHKTSEALTLREAK